MDFRLLFSSIVVAFVVSTVVGAQHAHSDLIVLMSYQYPGCIVSMVDGAVTAIDYPRDTEPPAPQDVIDQCSTLPAPTQVQAWLADETLLAEARADREARLAEARAAWEANQTEDEVIP